MEFTGSQQNSAQNDGIFLLMGNYVHIKALDTDFDTNGPLDADFYTNDRFKAKHRRLPTMFSLKTACIRLELNEVTRSLRQSPNRDLAMPSVRRSGVA
jgi:hypothetical protein